jgi:catechol 2,3-dioxygenase-like lactoylglutathione lyase family enzyme
MVGLQIERSNTVLYCAAWRETIAFYRDVIGLSVAADNTWFVEFRLTDTAFLSVADSSRASIADVGGQGITLTLRVADVDAVHAELAQRGVAVTPVSERWNARVCYCNDPEGHRIEFWSG